MARASKFQHVHRTLQNNQNFENWIDKRYASRWEETKEPVIKSQHVLKKQKPPVSSETQTNGLSNTISALTAQNKTFSKTLNRNFTTLSGTDTVFLGKVHQTFKFSSQWSSSGSDRA